LQTDIDIKNARIAQLEGALDLLLRHKDSIELRIAFSYALQVLGRETYYWEAK